MLIVHFQSSINFNSHSASTCYSNSVTEYTSGMYSFSSTPLPPFFFFICDDTPSSLHLLPSLAERLCKYHRRSGAYVRISHEADQHLIIRLSFHPSFSHFIPLVLAPPPSFLCPSPLSSFPPVQIHLPPSCLSILPLLPSAHSPLFISTAVPSQCSAFNHFVLL